MLPRTVIATTAVVVSAVLGAFAAATPASAATASQVSSGWKTDPEVWGVNDRAMGWNLSDPALLPRLIAIKNLKAKWVRFPVGWAWIQAAGRGTFRWTELDRTVRRLAESGIRWRVLLLDPPAWAKPDPTTTLRQPAADPVYVSEFVEALLKRYGSGGAFWAANRTLTARPVLDVELHNEPNALYFWGHDTATSWWRTDYTGDGWARLYGPALDRTQAKYPKVRFWMGGLVAPYPSSGGISATAFVKNAFAVHPKLATTLAGAAVHSYPYGGSATAYADPMQTVYAIADVVKALRTYGRSTMQVQLNEFGASRVGVASEENRKLILSSLPTLVRSDCPIQGFAPFEDIATEKDAGNPDEWYGLASPATAALYPEGAAYAGKVAAFNAGTEQGPALDLC